ncbi:MAG: AmmeMemoRadiSam system radical SAM enzyme [Pseudomonadota bacterium]
MKEAMFYEKGEDQKVKCHLCNHNCLIPSGKRGLWGVRENREGVLCALTYGSAIARNIDPIEKKPLFHFYPGSRSYSIAAVGCNFRCDFCQNYEISQMPKEGGPILGEPFPPEDVVAAAKRSRCASIAYTYTEPTIFFEYAYETAKLAQGEGIKNVFVSNGYMGKEALETARPWLHAANIDLKAFTERFYKKTCSARLKPVLDNLKTIKNMGIWLEITTLIIPTLNDSDNELGEIADFIKTELGPETPWHVSRFHPTFRLTDIGPTSVQTIMRAQEIGKKAGLYYVYTGNIAGQGGESTNCYRCGALLIERLGFSVLQNNITNGTCPSCHAEIHGAGL